MDGLWKDGGGETSIYYVYGHYPGSGHRLVGKVPNVNRSLFQSRHYFHYVVWEKDEDATAGCVALVTEAVVGPLLSFRSGQDKLLQTGTPGSSSVHSALVRTMTVTDLFSPRPRSPLLCRTALPMDRRWRWIACTVSIGVV